MDTIPVEKLSPGAVVVLEDGKQWLVLTSHLSGPWSGSIPRWELTLQPLNGGEPREERYHIGRQDMNIVRSEVRALEFVCRQAGELLLLDPHTNQMHTLLEDRTESDRAKLAPGATLHCLCIDNQAMWVLDAE